MILMGLLAVTIAIAFVCMAILDNRDKHKLHKQQGVYMTLKDEVREILSEYVYQDKYIGTKKLDQATSAILSAVGERVKGIIAEVETEISVRPTYPNMGKKGCVIRLKKLLTEIGSVD